MPENALNPKPLQCAVQFRIAAEPLRADTPAPTPREMPKKSERIATSMQHLAATEPARVLAPWRSDAAAAECAGWNSIVCSPSVPEGGDCVRGTRNGSGRLADVTDLC